VTPEEWESDLLMRVRAASEQKWLRHLTMEEIVLAGKYPDTEITFVFRATNRPAEWRFGWRWGPIWKMVNSYL